MKKDKLNYWREKTLIELNAEIASLIKTLAEKKLESKGGKLKNVRLVKNLKRDLAQLSTILRTKQLIGTSPSVRLTAKQGEQKSGVSSEQSKLEV